MEPQMDPHCCWAILLYLYYKLIVSLTTEARPSKSFLLSSNVSWLHHSPLSAEDLSSYFTEKIETTHHEVHSCCLPYRLTLRCFLSLSPPLCLSYMMKWLYFLPKLSPLLIQMATCHPTFSNRSAPSIISTLSLIFYLNLPYQLITYFLQACPCLSNSHKNFP